MRIVVTSSSGEPDPQLVEQIEAVDQSLRQSFSGFAVEDVVPEIESSFEHLPLSPARDVVDAYAQAVSDRADFELVVD